jgi:hypothetical protein
MPYTDDLPRRVPPWFGEDGRLMMEAAGERLDAVAQLLRDALAARLPEKAPADALPYIGQDRQLPQGPAESNSAYATRLRNAWEIWGGDNTPLTGKGGGAGSNLGILNALKAAGYPTGATGATIVQQVGRVSGPNPEKNRGYAQLDGSGNLVLGALMTCVNRQDLTGAVNPRPGWTFNQLDNFWSVFGLVFPTTTTVNAAEINAIVKKWRPAKALFIGTWVITAGRLLGWPTGRTLGTDPNLGGNTRTFYPGPDGEDTLGGYYP